MSPPLERFDVSSSGRGQLRDEVASYLRQLIISGRRRPGDTLRLGPLAEDLGVSTTPVREALLLLTQDGWMVQEPNRGFRVAPINRRDLYDAYLVNAFAASHLAARTAEGGGEEPVARLRGIDERIRALTDEGRLENLSLLNGELHRTIYAAADSPRMFSFAKSAARFVPRRFWDRVPGWVELNRDGHAPIIAAIEARDPEAAAREMHDHVIAAGDLLVDYLDSVRLFESDD